MTERIKVYTRSMDPNLYRLSGELLDVPWPRVQVMNSSPLGYLLTAIADEDADYVVNLDEDAFVFDNDVLMGLVSHVIDNGYVNCGMPDGGVTHVRHHNPLVTNPFFTVMHTARLREPAQWGEYIGAPIPDDLPEWFPESLLKHWYEPGRFEPYDEFLTWVALRFPTLYLDAREHEDGISTVLLDHDERPFLTHTWYGRDYHRQRSHYDRINKVISQCRRAG